MMWHIRTHWQALRFAWISARMTYGFVIEHEREHRRRSLSK